MNQSQQSRKRNLSQPTTLSTLKLPYLKPNKKMEYFRDQKSFIQKGKNFDLKTVNCTLPLYNPIRDKNLTYFFMKESNKKIVEQLKEEEKKKKKSKERKTERERLRGSHRGKTNEIAKDDFQRYMKEMKAKVISYKVE